MSQKARVADRIKTARERLELTQEVLAERVGRSVDTISALERGLALPSFETLEKLASALEMSPRDFFDGEAQEDDERAHLTATLLARARALSDADLKVAIDLVTALGKRPNPT